MNIRHYGYSVLRSLTIVLAVAGPLAWSGVAEANIVANGDFETGSLNPWNPSDPLVVTIDSANPNSGSYDAAIGGDLVTPGTLDQTLTTSTGQAYTLDFWASDAQSGGTSVDSLEVTFGGFSITITGDQAPGYTEFAIAIPGSDITSNSTDLLFAAGTLLYDFTFTPWNLDDVSVTPVTAAVPEPASIALLGAALTGFGFFGRRRRGIDRG